jgi:hypothetical protein
VQSTLGHRPVSPAKSALVGGESPKVNKPPSPQGKKFTLEPLKPLSPKDAQSHAGALTSPTRAASSRDTASTSPKPELVELPWASPLSPGPMDLGHLVSRDQVKACPCLSPKNNRNSINVLQSPYKTI